MDSHANLADLMAHSSFQFPVIKPLVVRRAKDAAFYWSQLDRAATSPQTAFENTQHFTNRMCGGREPAQWYPWVIHDFTDMALKASGALRKCEIPYAEARI